MIRFFRRIRQKLLTEGYLSKYLLYAIGEIALVMIGILLALQVNNWNQLRIQKNKEQSILIDLHEEFVQNKSTFVPHLNRKIEIKSRLESLIDAISDPSNDSPLKTRERGSSGAITYNPSQSTIQSVIETGMINIVSNDSLRYLLTNWNDLIQDYFEDEAWHTKFLQNRLYDYETKHGLVHYFKTRPGDGFVSPFYNESAMKEKFRMAYEDPVYQNLLLRNHQYLDGTVTEGNRIINMMNRIINLLKDEIQ